MARTRAALTKLAPAAPVLWAGAPVPEGVMEGRTPEAVELPEGMAPEGAAVPEGIAMAEEAAPEAAGEPEGAEMGYPAAAQIPPAAAASFWRSSAWHLVGAQAVTDSVILALPVVHWHLVSLRAQPEPWTALAKQGRAQLGSWLKS